MTLLIAEMKALEAQFQKPVYNDDDYILKRQTEKALGKVYKEIMKLNKNKSDAGK